MHYAIYPDVAQAAFMILLLMSHSMHAIVHYVYDISCVSHCFHVCTHSFRPWTHNGINATPHNGYYIFSVLYNFTQTITVIHKVRKTQHQNPEFGHTQGEIFFLKLQKKAHQHSTGDETHKTINFGGKLSFILSFHSPERLHCCYIYFHYSYYN